ncbi:Rh-like protein/ammonium transporter [Meredithblackwellia eburnea MCA 4105]
MSTLTPMEQWKVYEPANICFIITCTCFAWPIVAAVGSGYSGYSTRRNGLASFLPAIFAISAVSVQWWAVGYSIAFSEGTFMGDLKYAFHRGVLAEPVGAIPAILFSQFQMVFCATVCAITVGGFCERGRLLPILPFAVLWATFVYCPLVKMVWGGGYLEGSLDFAGGTPVHICSGASATAISVYLSWPQFRSRKSSVRTPQHLKLHRPHNSMQQLLALVTIWGGWLAFESGTTLELNFKSVFTLYTTNLCAASGSLTWNLFTFYETGKFSLDSTFMGAISGLVLITPSAGFVDMPTAAFFGVIGATICRLALMIKFTKFAARVRWVDNGDTFATHCIGGFAGTLLTGLFARKEVAAYDGTEILGGVIFDKNYGQLWTQCFEALFGFTWAFIGSYLIICLLDCIPGLEVLAKDEDIVSGTDASQMGESLWEPQWAEEVDYHPFGKGALEI